MKWIVPIPECHLSRLWLCQAFCKTKWGSGQCQAISCHREAVSCGWKHSCVRAWTGRLGGVRVEDIAVIGEESFTKKRSPGRWAGPWCHSVLTARQHVPAFQGAPGFLAAAMGPTGCGTWELQGRFSGLCPCFCPDPLCPQQLRF